MAGIVIFGLFLAFSSVSAAQELAKPHPGVDQVRVSSAIEKGTKWLLEQTPSEWPGHGEGTYRDHDLMAYTLLHAGANHLVSIQREEGTWGGTQDTCVAILFLKRATPSLPSVATGRRR